MLQMRKKSNLGKMNNTQLTFHLLFLFQALVLRSNALTGPPTGFISWICLFGRTQWIFMRSHKVRHWPCLRPYLLKSSGQACFPDLTQHGSIPTCIIPSSIIPILHHCSSCHWDSMVSPDRVQTFSMGYCIVGSNLHSMTLLTDKC